MVWIDIVVLAVVGVCAVLGLIRGFLKSLLALCGTVVTLVLAVVLAKPVGALCEQWWGLTTTLGNWATIAYIIGLFIILRIVVYILSQLFSKLTDRKSVSGFDKFLGFILGAGKGLLYIMMVFAVVFVLSTIFPVLDTWISGALVNCPITSTVYEWSRVFTHDWLIPFITGNPVATP